MSDSKHEDVEKTSNGEEQAATGEKHQIQHDSPDAKRTKKEAGQTTLDDVVVISDDSKDNDSATEKEDDSKAKRRKSMAKTPSQMTRKKPMAKTLRPMESRRQTAKMLSSRPRNLTSLQASLKRASSTSSSAVA
ncbi:hypothetical protein LB505_003394 [Fusarium chuoi]|nr:hypothetical protein LB505_003394 [Fusarium chuoi]